MGTGIESYLNTIPNPIPIFVHIQSICPLYRNNKQEASGFKVVCYLEAVARSDVAKKKSERISIL